MKTNILSFKDKAENQRLYISLLFSTIIGK